MDISKFRYLHRDFDRPGGVILTARGQRDRALDLSEDRCRFLLTLQTGPDALSRGKGNRGDSLSAWSFLCFWDRVQDDFEAGDGMVNHGREHGLPPR